mmetsp:Transcript_1113/g.127  ORF Transcript_1113/g.127 Transcript_1113/m.127 type:complete len:81 (+) Transcript_1113:932-1174(+)
MGYYTDASKERTGGKHNCIRGSRLKVFGLERGADCIVFSIEDIRLFGAYKWAVGIGYIAVNFQYSDITQEVSTENTKTSV